MSNQRQDTGAAGAAAGLPATQAAPPQAIPHLERHWPHALPLGTLVGQLSLTEGWVKEGREGMMSGDVEAVELCRRQAGA